MSGGTDRPAKTGAAEVGAARRVGAAHGRLSDDPVVVQRTNHTVVWLRPHDVIAKVGTQPESIQDLTREHAVATALTPIGAPIAPPLADVGPDRDRDTGALVTLWTRLEHDPAIEIPVTAIARSLVRLHEGLARIPIELPSFRMALRRARAVLAGDRAMVALAADDRSMLRGAFDRLRSELGERSFDERALHGEPHQGNLLVTADGAPRWVDLETACRGPLEWDLAFLPEEAAAQFPSVDLELLGLLRTLNSARVATWCWLRADVDDMRRHAVHHLEVVRRAHGVRRR